MGHAPTASISLISCFIFTVVEFIIIYMDEVTDKFNRSAVTNGKSLFVEKVDGRRAEARRWRDLLLELYDELLAPHGRGLSVIEKQNVRRLASVLLMAEVAEARLARGSAIDMTEYCTLVSKATKLSRGLGLGGELETY